MSRTGDHPRFSAERNLKARNLSEQVYRSLGYRYHSPSETCPWIELLGSSLLTHELAMDMTGRTATMMR